MAEFLTTTDTSASIERIIRGADKKLMLISAYVYPRMIYLNRLKDAAERGVQISLIFGKRSMDDKVMALFKEVDNLKIYYLDVLHAKCFVNEKEAVVTSLNLLNGSEEKNREMGVRLNALTDKDAYEDCVKEVRSILAEAKLIYSSTDGGMPSTPSAGRSLGKATTALPKNGYCIRCGESITCDPDAPLCYDDFTTWVRYKDPTFAENQCHICGTSAFVSMADPLCNTCNVKYAPVLKVLDNKRKEGQGFSKTAWRRKRS